MVKDPGVDMMLAGKTFSATARQAMLVASALCGLALASAQAEAQSVKRIFFNAAGSPINVGRNVNGNQVFTDNRGRFAGATRRTPSGTLIYDNRRDIRHPPHAIRHRIYR